MEREPTTMFPVDPQRLEIARMIAKEINHGKKGNIKLAVSIDGQQLIMGLKGTHENDFYLFHYVEENALDELHWLRKAGFKGRKLRKGLKHFIHNVVSGVTEDNIQSIVAREKTLPYQ